MNILVIENEKPAADRMIKMLRKTDRTATIMGVVETVEEAINRLQVKPEPDLILMDIQLDDGLCFEIFETINIDIPVIFTTAYDKYMLKAFKVNSIDYLLKPVDEASLKTAIDKFKKLYYDNKDPYKKDFRQLINEFRNQYKSRFLIRLGEKYKSIPSVEISHFHINERNVFLNDNHGRDYGVDYSLEQLQNMLDPRKFFRINRECIVNIESISMMYSYSSSRLQLTLKNTVETGHRPVSTDENDLFVVSRDKVAEFKKWIDR
jgi:DNA-binding LytR/AlgR family response regulator